MKIDITKYWERLWDEDLFAAIVLEEDFDLDENGLPRADCTNWEREHRAELTRLISKIEAGNGTADRAADYKRALSILDEMESESIKCADLFTASFADGDLMTGTLEQIYAIQNGRAVTIRPVVWLYKSKNGLYMLDYIMQGFGSTLGAFGTLADAEEASKAFNAQPAADVARMLHAETVKCFSRPMRLEALCDDGKRYPAEYSPECKTIYFAIPANISILGYIPVEEG